MEQIFYHIFEQLPRVGPGNYASTKKAFNIIRDAQRLPEKPRILDIGCGTGLHTIQLAKLSNGRITALDNHREFLERLKQNAKVQGMEDRIDCVIGDMGTMGFENRYFDIIWAEGSIFILGLKNGLNLWKKYLKTSGMMAFTDAFWLKSGAPGELKAYIDQMYTGMMGLREAVQVIESCDYHLTGHFQLPVCAWWDDYYRPLEKVLKDFHGKYVDNSDAMVILESLQKEIVMFRKYSDYYGYVFFILEKK